MILFWKSKILQVCNIFLKKPDLWSILLWHKSIGKTNLFLFLFSCRFNFEMNNAWDIHVLHFLYMFTSTVSPCNEGMFIISSNMTGVQKVCLRFLQLQLYFPLIIKQKSNQHWTTNSNSISLSWPNKKVINIGQLIQTLLEMVRYGTADRLYTSKWILLTIY